MDRLNCDKCVYLNKENICTLDKKKIVGRNSLTLNGPCIFKQEYIPDTSYEFAHLAAKAHIAVNVIKVCNNLTDATDFLTSENYPDMDTVVGKVDLALTFEPEKSALMCLIADSKVLNGKRMWAVNILHDDNVLSFCLKSSLPFLYIIGLEVPEIELELVTTFNNATVKNFEYYCFSNPIRPAFGPIISQWELNRRIYNAITDETVSV